MRMPGPNGRIGHAELQIGDSPHPRRKQVLPEMGHRGAANIGGVSVSLLVYLPDWTKLSPKRLRRERKS